MKFYYSFLIIFILFSCGSESNDDASSANTNLAPQPVGLYGNTQGTTFAIVSNDPIALTMAEVMTIFGHFDQALSGYIDTSIVSRLNQAQAGTFSFEDPYNYFSRCYRLSQQVYNRSYGCFDPTVYPLVDGWGFLKNIENVPDSSVIDSLRLLIGFQNGHHFTSRSKVSENGDTLNQISIVKNTSGAKLDFNAIAQGLSVDVIAEELERRGSSNYFVEIGGEIRVKGKNEEGAIWRIGIDQPIEESNAESRQIQEIVELKDKSIATSGSYRKFYEKNGIRYSHTLNPKTGYPVTHSLLSATVVAETCAIADAYATVFMVMGPSRSIQFVKDNPDLGLEIYLIFINELDEFETYYTKGFGDLIVIS